MRIIVVGAGYVGLSSAVLLAQKHSVITVDTNIEKVNLINKRISPIKDQLIQKYFNEHSLDLCATSELESALNQCDIAIISLPTNYSIENNSFDTSVLCSVIQKITLVNSSTLIVIKSTVPIGYTASVKSKCNNANVIFCPEFLREGHCLQDSLFPSRIVVGVDRNNQSVYEKTEQFITILKESILCEAEVVVTNTNEAESIKLFANAYLALRIAFFNELDTFAYANNYDVESIIKGMCLDTRIGDYYNNPSFGYGGYCLPKDTLQLAAHIEKYPCDIIKSVTKSNNSRKLYIANAILAKLGYNFDNKSWGEKIPKVGVYLLSMKKNSDNCRESSVLGILKYLDCAGCAIVIYDPILCERNTLEFKATTDLPLFKKEADLIIANRIDDELLDVKDKVFTRDIFLRD